MHNTYEIPLDLQRRIIAVVEECVDKKEQEKNELFI